MKTKMIMSAWWQWLGMVFFMAALLTLIWCAYDGTREVEEDD